MKPATVYTIAEDCGVTHATVSMALRNSPKVALKTRERIQQCAEAVGYRPNRSARQLATGHSYTLGYVFPSLLASYEATLGEALYLAASRVGYQLQFMLSGSDTKQQMRAIRDCLNEGVDGLIAVPSFPRRDFPSNHPLHDMAKKAFPSVLIGEGVEGVFRGIPVTYVDIARATFLVTQHLIREGYDTLRLLIPGEQSDVRREEGFRAALAEANIPFDPAWIIRCPVQFEEIDITVPDRGSLVAYRKYFNHAQLVGHGAEIARKALESKGSGSMGLVASNDDVAQGALAFCREGGLRIPGDVGIAGIDDTSAFMSDLTSVRWDYDGLAKHIIELLLAQIAGRDLPEEKSVGMELVLRRSTRLKH